MEIKRRIKCKFCSYSVPTWRTLKSGKRRSGWVNMSDHIERQHPEHKELARKILADYINEEVVWWT